MAQVTTGKNRLFGGTTMARIGELHRTAVVAASEVSGLIPADTDFPTTVDVIRREPGAAGNPAAGIAATWAAVAGLAGLVGHVRNRGKWVSKDTGLRVSLNESERIVLLTDIPAGGDGAQDILLLTDRLRFTDQTKGASVWKIEEARINTRDGIVVAFVRYAREDMAQDAPA